jgi:hypothetical protein
MLIKDLKSPYKELAELRRFLRGKTNKNLVRDSFVWESTPEGTEFWAKVSRGKYPIIPLDSLAELVYREQRELIFKLI